jgi:hypothetical protein
VDQHEEELNGVDVGVLVEFEACEDGLVFFVFGLD